MFRIERCKALKIGNSKEGTERVLKDPMKYFGSGQYKIPAHTLTKWYGKSWFV